MLVKIIVKPINDIWYKYKQGEIFNVKTIIHPYNKKKVFQVYNEVNRPTNLWIYPEHTEIIQT